MDVRHHQNREGESVRRHNLERVISFGLAAEDESDEIDRLIEADERAEIEEHMRHDRIEILTGKFGDSPILYQILQEKTGETA
jgi:hypothetical protein